MTDLISRQAAIDALWKALYDYEDKTERQFQESDDLDISEWMVHRIFVQNMGDIDRQTILNLPSAQPEITDEQAIEHLQSTGWMQNHDREIYDMGIKKQLADDSGSYDSLLPSAQPEIIACGDCKHWIRHERRCGYWNHGVKPLDWCCYAERRTECD